MITEQIKHILSLLEKEDFSKEKVITILGPTASGKTKLAVALAQIINAEIISADSRQVYKKMDIGTGKDLSEYQEIPYHLIDICEPSDRYHLGQFIRDFQQAFEEIKSRNKYTILCGGTGLYLQQVLQGNKYGQIPSIEGFKEPLYEQSKEELISRLNGYQNPVDLHIDCSTKKRIIRGIEILEYLATQPLPSAPSKEVPAIVFGINPATETRREQISERLHKRLEDGLIHEVKNLLADGIGHEQLQYFGLEYKYASLYLSDVIDYDFFCKKLETEIHRYAKRQMTYFRKMEKDNIIIHWL